MEKGQVTKHMDEELTKTYIFISKYQHENGGFSPTFREIQDGLGLSSLCLVQNRINKMIERGLLIKKGRQVRIKS